MNKNKIVLAYPSVGSEAKGMSIYPPLSVLYLASNLRDFSVKIFDQRVDKPEKFDLLLNENPICVGISTMTGIQIKYALELAEKTKKKNIPTVFGGVHPTIFPEQTLEDPRVDYVIKGEGETAFRNLVESLAEGKKPDSLIKDQKADFKKSPLLPYELVDIENYVHTVAVEGRSLPFLFSRGCPYGCTFCCNPILSHRKWETMEVDTAASQLETLVEKYSLDSISFLDENLAVNPRILNSLAKEINGKFKWFMQARANSLLNYDLKFLEKMGAWRFSCGLESGSNRILEGIKKEENVEEYIESNRRLSKTNINPWYNYIIGFPDEELKDLKATVNLALQILDENPNAINNTFAMLVPYPGTEIFEDYLNKDLIPKKLEDWKEFGRYNFAPGFYSPEMVSLYKKIYFSSKFTGKKFLRSFPEDQELKDYTAVLTDKWKRFDFYDDREWGGLEERGKNLLKKLFGDNAY